MPVTPFPGPVDDLITTFPATTPAKACGPSAAHPFDGKRCSNTVPYKLQKSPVRLQVHPVNEALFNLVGAWGMMLLPLMLQDKRAGHVKKKWTIWTATMVS